MLLSLRFLRRFFRLGFAIVTENGQENYFFYMKQHFVLNQYLRQLPRVRFTIAYWIHGNNKRIDVLHHVHKNELYKNIIIFHRGSIDDMRTSAANLEAGVGQPTNAPRANLVTNEQPMSFTGVPGRMWSGQSAVSFRLRESSTRYALLVHCREHGLFINRWRYCS